MKLKELQEKFKSSMLRHYQKLDECDPEFLEQFDNNHIPVLERIKVYHNNIVGSLSEALRSTFPIVEKLVGDDFMKMMTSEFVFDNPPKNASLYQYGQEFENFIKTYQPAKSLPYLSDIAKFEWAINQSYYAADDKALTADELSQIPPEKLEYIKSPLRKSANLFESDYPILQIKDFCLNDGDGENPNMSERCDTRLLISRPKLEVDIIPIKSDEFTLLKKLNDLSPLGKAVENTLEKYPDFDFPSFLQKHIELETFAHVKANDFERT